MEFQTQKELLEYLGKNPNDRNLVKRMMRNGDVDYHDGMWYLIDKDLMIKELQEKVVELQEEVKRLKKEEKSEQVNAKNFEDTAKIIKLNDELYEAKVQWEYYENLYNEEVKDKQNRIRKAFLWIKNIKPSANWEEFRDWILNDNE